MSYENSKKEIIKILNSFYTKSKYEVFKDFLKISTIEIANAVNYNQNQENEYLNIIKKYNKNEIENFSKMFCLLVNGLNEKFGDFLGELYMELEQGNKKLGQFFTPYSISSFMSHILFSDKEKDLKNKGLITIQEPACGSGGMIIATAETIKNKGYNYQKILYVEATDLEETAFFMSYIQLSLYGIQAKVINGNTLTQEKFKILYTPMYYFNNKNLILK